MSDIKVTSNHGRPTNFRVISGGGDGLVGYYTEGSHGGTVGGPNKALIWIPFSSVIKPKATPGQLYQSRTAKLLRYIGLTDGSLLNLQSCNQRETTEFDPELFEETQP